VQLQWLHYDADKSATMSQDLQTFSESIDRRGHYLVEKLLPGDTVARLREALEAAIEEEARFHGGTDYQDFGMVLCCPMYDRAFIEVLNNEELMAPVEAVLGAGCITYSYCSSSQPPGSLNFSGRVHVDCPRLIPGYLTNFGCIMLLDDFTEENGATWYLSGSHEREDPPSEEEFYANAERLVAKAGSVWFFNTRLWHAGGRNTTDRWRHSLAINFCRPYMKQRFDLPRMLGDQDLSGFSERSLQKLGFLAQTPTSLDEYYVPPEKRKFRQPYE
jgi:ectoine hydroxylase-related dioxygenase (phytanoyl-CoA dioxygenase family)